MQKLLKYSCSLCLLAGCLISNTVAVAQKVDSSYHNYLYDSRVAYFKQLKPVKKSILFWGDSITDWGDWAEMLGFKRAINRGIAGDNTFGLKGRIDEVVRHQPKKLFILIGTNDLNKKIPVEYIVENYRKIIAEIRERSAHTRIYMQSVFPINDSLIGRQYYTATNDEILNLNKALKSLAENLHLPYLDLHAHLKDAAGQLDARYTYDGLHLSGLGYRAWVDFLETNKTL